MRRLIAAGLALVCLAGAGAAAGVGRQLSAQQLGALAPGSYDGYYKNTLHIVIRLEPGGKASGSAGGIPHRGHWGIENGKFCLTVSFLIFSKKKCDDIYSDGHRFYGMLNGAGTPRLVMRAAGKTNRPVRADTSAAP